MNTKFSPLVAVVAGLTATGALAQPASVATLPTLLTVVAEGRVTRPPDIAELSGGVVTAAPTAEAAMRDNASRMAAVVAAARAAGIAPADIQTAGISLAPQYRYADNQPPVLTGYQASNTVALRLRRLGDAGRLLDTMVRVGANQIAGPVFRVQNGDAALDEARVAAVALARSRAQLYAAAAGLKVRRIASIVESPGNEPRPMAMAARMDKAEASTPVEPGSVALTISVTMIVELE